MPRTSIRVVLALTVALATTAARRVTPTTTPAATTAESTTHATTTTTTTNATTDPAAATSRQAVDPQVAAWLAQLAGDDVAARDEAQRHLLDFADDATPALRAARLTSRDPDVRMRLDTLLAERGERSLIGPSRVTLHFVDAPLPDVLAAFAKATGAQVDDNVTRDGQPPIRLSLDVRDASYWRALAALADAAKIGFQPRGDRVLHVYRANQIGGGLTLRGAESGPFLFQPVSATYSRSQQYGPNGGGGGAAEPSFSFQMQVMTEPKLRLSDQAMRVDVRRAVDSAGNDLLVGGNNGNSNIYGNGNDALNVNLNLAYPKAPGETIGEISGAIHVPVATRTSSIDVDDLLAQPTIARDLLGIHVEIRPVPEPKNPAGNNNANNGFSRCEFVVAIGANNADPNAANRLQLAFQRARVNDGAGRPLQLTNFSSNGDGRQTEIRIGYSSQGMRQGQAGGGPYQLHVDVPTAFRELDVPFTFKGLKMP